MAPFRRRGVPRRMQRRARRVNAQREFRITSRKRRGERDSSRDARAVVLGAAGEASLAVTLEGVFMKRSWTAMAVALTALFAAMGCNDYGNTFQTNTGASISALSPSNATAGSQQFTLQVIGGGFVAKTVVQWNGQTIPTQIQTDANGNVTLVTATVAPALVAKPGTAFVNTLQPHSGAGTNGLSNPIAFIVNPPGNPLPVVSPNGLSPICAVAGGGAFTLTVTGSNFLPTSDPSGGSQVLWGAVPSGTQTTLATVSASTTQVQATVSSALIAAAGTANVSVFNPPATNAGTGNGGGGTSQTSLPFTIASACPASSARPAAAVQSVGEETSAVSADGRYVAFAATQAEHSQIFVRDTCQGATEACQARTLLVSSAMDGAVGNDDSQSPSMSADGRYIAFSSAATNLFAQAPPGPQIYLRDTCLGVRTPCVALTQLVSTDAQGALAGTEAISPSVSPTGRFVTFVAVTPSKGNNSRFRQVFVRDTCLATSNCTPTTVRTP